MSINTVAISGNLAANAELRATKSGTPVLSATVAVNERARQEDGSYADRANYVDLVLFGRRANALAQYLMKGTYVSVQGRLRQSSYEDRNGIRRSKVEVVVEELDWRARTAEQTA